MWAIEAKSTSNNKSGAAFCPALAGLITGNEDIDNALRQAFSLGVRHGQATDKKCDHRSIQLNVTQQILATLMRVQHLDLEAAMATLQIPKSDRKTYKKLFATKERQRQARAKKCVSN